MDVRKLIVKWEPVSWSVFVLGGAILISPHLEYYLGKWEGALFPVVNPKFTITSIEEIDNNVVVSGRAFKRRDCNYVLDSLRWYLGEKNGAHAEVRAYFTDPPTIRENERWTSWEGVVVDLSPFQITTNSFATVDHKCSSPWKVTSVFYEARVSE